MGDTEPKDERHRFFPDYSPEAQLQAVMSLHARLRIWDKECQDLVEEADVEFYSDACSEATYAAAASSHAMVGALAPFIEGMFHHEFAYIGYLFNGKRPDVKSHPARSQFVKDADFWNPAKHANKDGSVAAQDNICVGTIQLLKALTLKPRFSQSFPRVIEAIFAYRNYALHSGYEWPLERRKEFTKKIETKRWEKWFSWATIDGEPWIAFMTDEFVDECLTAAAEAMRVFDRYREELQPPPSGMVPEWIQKYIVDY